MLLTAVVGPPAPSSLDSPSVASDLVREFLEFVTTWQVQVDPVSSLIAVVALILAVRAQRHAKRSADTAERLAQERGQLKSVVIRLAGFSPHLRDGRPVGLQAEHPKADMSTGSLDVCLYSGADELKLDRVRLQLKYVKGTWNTRVYYLTLNLGMPSAEPLIVSGLHSPTSCLPTRQSGSSDLSVVA